MPHLYVFIYFLLAHLLADFVFQPESLLTWKHKNWKGIFVHAVILFAVSLALFWPLAADMNLWGIGILGLNAAVHYLVDARKINKEKTSHEYVKLFFLDQLLHMVILVLMTLAVGYLYTFPYSTGLYALTALCPTDSTCGLLTFLTQFLPFAVYLIVAVLCTYVYEIVKFQAARQKHVEKGGRDWPRGWAMKFNYKSMFLRLMILSLIFGLALFFGGFRIAQTFLFE